MKIDLKKSVLAPVAILLVSLVLVNLIARNWFKRIDLTDNKRFSLSESSRVVVREIDDLMTMKVYFSDDLPGEYGNTRRYLQDILEEYEAYGKGNIRFEFTAPETNEELQEEAQKSGVMPVQMQVVENDKIEIKNVFMGMTILHEDKREVLPVIRTTTGLEFEITTKIKKLVAKNKQTVGLATADDQNAETQTIEQLLRERYQVHPVNLKNPVPTDIKVILVRGVVDTLSDSVRANLEGFLNRSGNLLLAQSSVNANLTTQQGTDIESDIFEILDSYGLQLQNNLVLDRTCATVNVTRNMGIIRMNVPMEYPFLPLVRSFNTDEPLVSGLEQVRLYFPSEITVKDSLPENVSVTSLFSSSDKSATMSGFYNLNPDPQANPIFRRLNKPGKVLAARSEKVNKETGLVSQVILVADSKFLDDGSGAASPENHIFMMNAVDYLMGDRGLIELRSREITSRPLKELPDDARRTWKWVNIFLPSVLVVGFGLIRNRRQKRNARHIQELYD